MNNKGLIYLFFLQDGDQAEQPSHYDGFNYVPKNRNH